MFNKDVIETVVRMYEEGNLPSEILREVVRLYPQASVVDLMELMCEAFSLPHTAVQCIGGWWHDGISELSDVQLDSFLVAEIVKASQG